MADFAFLLPILFLFGRMDGARALLGDGDTGWHIRTGEWILANHRVPRTDIFSFTRAGAPWYAWEWLADVMMALLHRTGGMPLVLFGAIAVLCTVSALVYRLVLRKSQSVPIAFALTALAGGGSAIHWLARPHLCTMLFLAIFCTVLESRRGKLLLILPPLTAIWTNLHGGFLAGLLLLAAWAGGEALSALFARSRTERRVYIHAACRYGLTACACAAASLANPYGWRLFAHIAEFFGNPDYFANIAEFASLSFRHPLARFFELMLFAGAGAATQCLRERRFTGFLLLAGFGHMALLSSRNIPLFMIAAAPQAGLAIARSLVIFGRKTREAPIGRLARALHALSGKFAGDRRTGPSWLGLAVLSFVGLALIRPAPATKLRTDYDPARYPAGALAVLRPTDRIFTSDTWGGYLIYRRFPSKVFIDGRSDFYGPAFEASYLQVMNVNHRWQSILRRGGVDTVLLPVDTSLAGAIKLSPEWRVAFDDGVSIVFRSVSLR